MDISPVEIRVQTLSELNEYIAEAIKKQVKKHTEDLLHRVSHGENLSYEGLKEKYGHILEENALIKLPKKKRVDSADKCQACISSGDRCSRKCKGPEKFCGGHLNSRPYGVIALKDSDVEEAEKLEC